MPTYDYLCKECGYRFEHFQSMSSPTLKTRPFCENCKKKNCNVERLISGGTGLIFKGSGFYLTDYKNKNVTIIGSGCTAITMAPSIIKEAKKSDNLSVNYIISSIKN